MTEGKSFTSIAPPKRKPRIADKAASLAIPAVPDNMSRSVEDRPAPGGRLVDLNFKVNPRYHKRFRVEAALAEMSLKDVMIEAFEEWLAKRGKRLEDDER